MSTIERIRLGDLAAKLGCELHGDPERRIRFRQDAGRNTLHVVPELLHKKRVPCLGGAEGGARCSNFLILADLKIDEANFPSGGDRGHGFVAACIVRTRHD